jgi:hypothetical protein
MNETLEQHQGDRNEIILLDERGHPLEPPFLLVTDVVRMKLLEGVKVRRVQQMIEEGVLPAKKATKEEELALLRNGRVRSLTVKGIYLIEPAAVDYARSHRRPVGFPKGTRRS